MDATINGLMDGISVLETNNDVETVNASDILYNVDFDKLSRDFGPDDGFIYTPLEECPIDYLSVIDCLANFSSSPIEARDQMDGVNLLSVPDTV